MSWLVEMDSKLLTLLKKHLDYSCLTSLLGLRLLVAQGLFRTSAGTVMTKYVLDIIWTGT